MKYLVGLLMLGLLGGCTQLPSGGIAVGPAVLPNQVPIDEPPDPQLLPVTPDVPRDMSRKTVKQSPECLNATVRDASWQQTCMENPPLPNSNIFVGFDQTSWNNYLLNTNRLISSIKAYKYRICLENEKRAAWRAGNTAKVEALSKEPTTPPTTPSKERISECK